MQAIKEVGLRKSLRFLYTTLFLAVFQAALVPPVRKLLLQAVGARIGRETVLHNLKFFNVYHTGFSNFATGDFCFLGDECMLDLYGSIVLEDHVTIANRGLLLTHTNVGYEDHPLQKYFPHTVKGIHIKRGAFIGAGAIIMPGVTIGENAVIGAGSVVTKNVASWAVVAGNPARLLRQLKQHHTA